MTMRLPHGDRAVLDRRKLEDYCLNADHPRGRHKARLFRTTLGLSGADAAWLRGVLLDAAGSHDAVRTGEDAWGSRWRLDVTVRRHGRSAVIRSVWIVRAGETIPRFVTCWVL